MVLEPFANCEIEKRLGEMGVIVDRSIYLSDWAVEHVIKDAFRIFRKSKLLNEMANTLSFRRRPRSETIGSTVAYANEGLDGVIQVALFTCMPEIIAQDILMKIPRDSGILRLTLFWTSTRQIPVY